MKILLGDFNVKVGREDFLKRKLGMKVYTKLVNFATPKTSESKVRCSHIAVSINILGSLQMGKPTIGLTVF
jgi:hypothetical protein